jgi:hypothetical protein
VACGSLVMDNGVFWNHIPLRVLGLVSESIVNRDYFMDKLINVKQIYLYFFSLSRWSDASVMGTIVN